MNSIEAGFVPIRKSIFSMPDMIEYARFTRKRLRELGVEFADITSTSGEGLLYDKGGRLKIEEKLRREGIGGLFFPRCSFGTEYVVARMARGLSVPVLLWGPRDERPDENGVRLRDSQCSLLATEEVLRRFRVPFIHMTNCHLESAKFERRTRDPLAVCNVIRVFRNTRILQITPRPFDFWFTMCNKEELLKEFNIQLVPISMPELTVQVKLTKEEGREIKRVMEYCRQIMGVKVKEEESENIAATKVAMKHFAVKYGCNAVAIQCWSVLQSELDIISYTASSLLSEGGLPVACETDIHGTIIAVMVEVVAIDGTRGFLADWTVCHSDNENGELFQHCNPWSISVAQEKSVIGYPLVFDYPGAVEALAKYGDVTLVRFDGDSGEYSMLMGNAKGIEGLCTKGTYLWVKVENLKRLGDKLVYGPYIHHYAGTRKKVVPVSYEACKYIGTKPDLYGPIEGEVKVYIRGE